MSSNSKSAPSDDVTMQPTTSGAMAVSSFSAKNPKRPKIEQAHPVSAFDYVFKLLSTGTDGCNSSFSMFADLNATNKRPNCEADEQSDCQTTDDSKAPSTSGNIKEDFKTLMKEICSNYESEDDDDEMFDLEKVEKIYAEGYKSLADTEEELDLSAFEENFPKIIPTTTSTPSTSGASKKQKDH